MKNFTKNSSGFDIIDVQLFQLALQKICNYLFFQVEHKERSRLYEELQTTQETLHTTSQNATEALTRLEVLGKYFQERESELLK